jgi:hypothetical protein
VPEIKVALTAFARALAGFNVPWVLIGGVSLGAYTRPRTTLDADVALLSDASIEDMVSFLTLSFRRNRAHAFTHKATGVEIELVTPGLIEKSPELIAKILATAENDSLGGSPIKVASLEGMIASKLARATRQDQADIESLVRAQGAPSLAGWPLNSRERALYAEISGSI